MCVCVCARACVCVCLPLPVFVSICLSRRQGELIALTVWLGRRSPRWKRPQDRLLIRRLQGAPASAVQVASDLQPPSAFALDLWLQDLHDPANLQPLEGPRRRRRAGSQQRWHGDAVPGAVRRAGWFGRSCSISAAA